MCCVLIGVDSGFAQQQCVCFLVGFWSRFCSTTIWVMIGVDLGFFFFLIWVFVPMGFWWVVGSVEGAVVVTGLFGFF